MRTVLIAAVVLGAVGVARLLATAAPQTGVRPQSPTSQPDTKGITAVCRLVRGPELATILKLNDAKFDPDAIYAYGYLLNSSGRTAYVTGNVVISEFPQFRAEIRVPLIRPGGRIAAPFLAKTNATLDAGIDVTKLHAYLQVDRVTHK